MRKIRNATAHPVSGEQAGPVAPENVAVWHQMDPPSEVLAAWATIILFEVYRIAVALTFAVDARAIRRVSPFTLAVPTRPEIPLPTLTDAHGGKGETPNMDSVSDSPYHGKYAPLSDFLRDQAESVSQIEVPLARVEELLAPDMLPPSAYKYSAW